MRWTLILDETGHTGADNMNTDYALLRRAREGVGFVRLYRWDPPCLSFGRNEPALRRYDIDRIRDLGIDTVRRPTGGRAVWHEHEVTYSVTAPPGVFGTLREAYHEIHRVLGQALHRLGAPVVQADASRPNTALTAGACFTNPVGGELVHRGKKIVGSAQMRVEHGMLQHGSILLVDRQDRVAQVTLGPHAPSQAGDLATVLGRPISFADVAHTIADTAPQEWPGDWDIIQSSYLEPECYNFDDSDWTWRR